jgi:sugar diacid utilization regulator
MMSHSRDLTDGSESVLIQEILALLYRNAGEQEFTELRLRLDTVVQSTAEKDLLYQSLQMAEAIKERFEEHQQRERGLNAVIETAQDLTAIHDIDRVLQAIVHRARKLMGADIGYLSIYDKEQGDFYVRATDGAFSEKFKQIRVGHDIGICGYVARNKSPFSSAEYGKDPRFAHTHPIDTAVTEEGIKSILGVPLLSGIDVIGVLFVGDRYVRSYKAWDMSILSTLAAHASVAIENARLFEQTQIALKQASDVNALLKKQTADIQIAAEAHEQLTSLVARGGGAREICEMVANMLKGHVAIVDEGEEEIHAFSAGVYPGNLREVSGSKSQELLYTRENKVHAALVESRIIGRSVAAYVASDEVCRVSAVVGSRGLVGGLIIRTADELNEVEVRIFERSAMVTGVVLLSQERHDHAAREEIPAILRGLLSHPQHNLARLSEQAARHGLDLSKPLCLAVVQVDADKSHYVLKKMRNGLGIANTLFDEIDGSLVFISGISTQSELREAIQRFFDKEIREPITGVISKSAPKPSILPDVFQSILRCLGMLAVLERRGSIFHEQELSLYSVLFEKHSAEDLDNFLSSVLGKLYQKEKHRNAELARTLLSYLDHGHNARAAASAQGIHINTFRQRLEAIDSLLGDWTDPRRSLEIHVALRLWQLREDETP